MESSCEVRNQSLISLFCNQEEFCKVVLLLAGRLHHLQHHMEAVEKLEDNLSMASSGHS